MNTQDEQESLVKRFEREAAKERLRLESLAAALQAQCASDSSIGAFRNINSAEQLDRWLAIQKAQSTGGLDVGRAPMQPSYRDFITKYGGDRAVWRAYWSGMMPSDERAVFDQQYFTADNALKHLLLPMMNDMLKELYELRRRFDEQNDRNVDADTDTGGID